MYYKYLKTRNEDFEFYALCHGAKPSKSSKSANQSLPAERPSGNLLFDDPDKYGKMSQEQKEELTQQMKSKFKTLFDGANIVPSGGVGKIQRW
jgi:hypothetical protein